jgi:hypothetical protein
MMHFWLGRWNHKLFDIVPAAGAAAEAAASSVRPYRHKSSSRSAYCCFYRSKLAIPANPTDYPVAYRRALGRRRFLYSSSRLPSLLSTKYGSFEDGLPAIAAADALALETLPALGLLLVALYPLHIPVGWSQSAWR